MEHHRDEHIVCGDCGASFLFSAGEAAVFVERGLAAPKRCKECRLARKGRASSMMGAAHSGNGPPRAGAPQRGERRPHYTGDVNEYRSPMQDRFDPSAAYAGNFGEGANRHRGSAPRGPRGDAAQPHFQRAPFFQAATQGSHSPRPGPVTARGGFARARHDQRDHAPPAAGDRDGNTQEGRGAPPPTGPRRRVQAEMFSITCNACGANAEVPFRPAEGREVFCQTCYRARKPA